MKWTDWLPLVNLAIATLMGVCLGIAGAGTSGTVDFLYKWQTLFAGILAVVAAGLTIFQMERTDWRQQVRHKDLVKLNLRADELRVRRAYAVLSKYQAAVPVFRNALDGFKRRINGDVDTLPPPTLRDLMNVAGFIRKAISDDMVGECLPLFTAELVEAFRLVDTQCTVTRSMDFMRLEIGEAHEMGHNEKTAILEEIARLEVVGIVFQRMIDGTRELLTAYAR
ncbi:MAG: hypothetical protein BGN87_06410 [Rhizobiales bacterium 65-79]|mgnify:CR=1 FL=1|nr:hypothetical protein [Hyphomicrobiales bacterium]OJU02822.1 MAG: hypothetical protein BGN87_06410 [Rhizobiales bacterium 65-79]